MQRTQHTHIQTRHVLLEQSSKMMMKKRLQKASIIHQTALVQVSVCAYTCYTYSLLTKTVVLSCPSYSQFLIQFFIHSLPELNAITICGYFSFSFFFFSLSPFCQNTIVHFLIFRFLSLTHLVTRK